MDIFTFLYRLWQVIAAAMLFDERVYHDIEASSQSGQLIATIVMLGGASLLLGESTVLFVNQVRPARFFASLLLNGVIYVIGYAVWAVTIWLVAMFVFEPEQEQTLYVTVRVVGLGTAPFVFGFLVLMPYVGPVIARVLYVWSLLIIFSVVQFTFQITYVQAMICTGIGWLLMLGMSRSIGMPVVLLRNWIWQKLTGTQTYTSAQDLLLAFAQLGDYEVDDRA